MKKLDEKKLEQIAGGKTYGERVNDCIADAYAHHGLTSAWLTIQSAFVPATTVAIATACAYANADPD